MVADTGIFIEHLRANGKRGSSLTLQTVIYSLVDYFLSTFAFFGGLGSNNLTCRQVRLRRQEG